MTFIPRASAPESLTSRLVGRIALLAVLGALLATAPAVVSAQVVVAPTLTAANPSAASPPSDAPQGSEPRWLFVGIGAGLFLAEYGGGLVLTAARGGTAAQLEHAAIPVAGPWLELTDGASRAWWEVGLGVLGGVAHLAGITLLVVGLAWQRPRTASTRETAALGPSFRLGAGSAGMTMSFW
jgi:hypothetical protein